MAEGGESQDVQVDQSKSHSDPMQNILKSLETSGGFTVNHTQLDSALTSDLSQNESRIIELDSKTKATKNPDFIEEDRKKFDQNRNNTTTNESKEDLAKPFTPNLILSSIDFDFMKQLKMQKLLPADFPDDWDAYETDADFEKAGIHLLRPYGRTLSALDIRRKQLPEAVIVHVPNETAFDKESFLYSDIAIDYWKLPPEKRPQVIVYYDNFNPPLYKKQRFRGFLEATNPKELLNVVEIAKEVLKHKESDKFDPKLLEPGQAQSYDESDDLREWENITADTYQSLKYLFERINRKHIDGERVVSVLDAGTGEGRIGASLARVGFNVLGLDISKETLKRGKERFKLEGEGLRGEKEHKGLAYSHLLRLQKEHRLPIDPNTGKQMELLLDDSDAANHYVTVEGSFSNMYGKLNEFIAMWWKNHQTNLDRYEFFNENIYDESYPSEDVFMDLGFDEIIINWNTLWEFGNKENQEEAFENFFDMLNRDGEIFIEIADRTWEPYKTALDEYHKIHPDTPYGTLQDKKTESEDYPPRYLSDVLELGDMLRGKGFDVNIHLDDIDVNNPGSDVFHYFIEKEDPETGEMKKTAKVYVITARKS